MTAGRKGKIKAPDEDRGKRTDRKGQPEEDN
jgi:hypothetical protein